MGSRLVWLFVAAAVALPGCFQGIQISELAVFDDERLIVVYGKGQKVHWMDRETGNIRGAGEAPGWHAYPVVDGNVFHFVANVEKESTIWTSSGGTASQATPPMGRIFAFAPWGDRFLAIAGIGEEEKFKGEPNKSLLRDLFIANRTHVERLTFERWSDNGGAMTVNANGTAYFAAWRSIGSYQTPPGGTHLLRFSMATGLGPLFDPDDEWTEGGDRIGLTCRDGDDLLLNVLEHPFGEPRSRLFLFDSELGRVTGDIPSPGWGCPTPDRSVSIELQDKCFMTCNNRILEWPADGGKARTIWK